MAQVRHGVENQAAEWSYVSARSYADPFNEIELDVVFTGRDGSWRVPAFWAGGNALRRPARIPRPSISSAAQKDLPSVA